MKQKLPMQDSKSLPKILAILRQLQDEIRQKYRAEIVGVFGSYARDEARQHSDVDILAHFLEGASLFDLVGLTEFLEENLGIKVDIVSERAIRSELQERILSEVVRI